KVGKDDSVTDRRVFERAPVGVRDRLHQEPDDVLAARKKAVEERAGRRGLIVVEVHLAGGLEELVDRRGLDLEPLREQTREVLAVERRRQRKHRIVEADMLELHD